MNMDISYSLFSLVPPSCLHPSTIPAVDLDLGVQQEGDPVVPREEAVVAAIREVEADMVEDEGVVEAEAEREGAALDRVIGGMT